MNVDLSVFEATIEELNKMKASMTSSKDNVSGIVNSISSNWKSEASDQLVKNINSSMNVFQSYIDELDEILKFVIAQKDAFVAAEQANTAIAGNIGG